MRVLDPIEKFERSIVLFSGTPPDGSVQVQPTPVFVQQNPSPQHIQSQHGKLICLVTFQECQGQVPGGDSIFQKSFFLIKQIFGSQENGTVRVVLGNSKMKF